MPKAIILKAWNEKCRPFIFNVVTLLFGPKVCKILSKHSTDQWMVKETHILQAPLLT